MTGSGKKKLSTPARKAGKSKSAKSGSGDGSEKKKGVVARAASRVGKAIRTVTAKVRPAAKAKEAPAKTPRAAKSAATASKARATRRVSDIPMDQIAGAYTPEHTSLKSGMRGNGAGKTSDQDFGRGVADDRWNDEDVITNKSGDPRIGTHGRTYEPGEARAASSGNRK